MPKVYMDDPVRVQSVGTGGIGFAPPVPVEDVEKISETGREMYGVQGKANVLPNPVNEAGGRVVQTSDGAFVVEPASPMEKIYNPEMLFGAPVITELCDDGYTFIKNTFVLNKCVAPLGAFYSNGQFNIRNIFSYYSEDLSKVKVVFLYDVDSENEPFEFTLDNAPYSLYNDLPAAGSFNLTYGSKKVNATTKLDLRLAAVHYDTFGNIDDIIYSAQYRYTQTGGVVTRVKVATTPQSPYGIIDIGAYKPTSSQINSHFMQTAPSELLMLVSREQTERYQLKIPPSMFEGATYGLALAFVRGDGAAYTTQSFYKPEPGLPTMPTSDGTYKLRVVVDSGVPTLSWEAAT